MTESFELANIDLKGVSERAQKRLGWSDDRVQVALEDYRRFLRDVQQNGAIGPGPSEDGDEIWHLHILDSNAYFRDCASLFGFYLHHNPAPAGEAKCNCGRGTQIKAA